MDERYLSARYLLGRYGEHIKEKVDFQLDATLSGDDYRIENRDGALVLFGNSSVAFNSAVGKVIRLGDRAAGRTFHFQKSFRCIYFANHFYNFYHSAPIETVCDYIEELALWGQNVFALWFDMHHFSSFQDEQARKMLDKMEIMYAKARQLGMKTLLTHLGNEYYSQSPQSLRAECSTENGLYKLKPGGFYYTELCPAKDESVALLQESLEQILRRFQTIGIDYLNLFPYDQGGCTCQDCYPWGAVGFYKIAKLKAKRAREIFPDIQIIYSTWRFGVFCEGEWEAVMSSVKNDSSWIDCFMVDANGFVPDDLYSFGKPVLSFPEISMHGATPWGGFGANPFVATMKERITYKESRCDGGNVYSEGIFEDINKVVILELFRDSTLSAEEILREYAAYYFEECVDELVELILCLEKTLVRNVVRKNGKRCNYPVGPQTELPMVEIDNTQPIEEIARHFEGIDRKLPDHVRKSWRYRILYLRAMGDYALLQNGGNPTAQSDEIYGQLKDIYFAENAFYFLAPFTRESFLTNRSDAGHL